MSSVSVLGLAIFVVLGGCLVEPELETDRSELTTTSRTKATTKCAAPKVKLCHLPGGDPAKAETLCIAASAVNQHQFHHGDSLGACPEVHVCAPYFEPCDSPNDCCLGAACTDEICTPQI